MNLQKAKELYPIDETIAGFYDCINVFKCNTVEDLEKINTTIPPFSIPQDGYFNFVRYMGDNQFESWVFSYLPIKGYLVLEGEETIPMTYCEDFGWEEYIEEDNTAIFGKRFADADYVAQCFDAESYAEGCIFTSEKELTDFIARGCKVE